MEVTKKNKKRKVDEKREMHNSSLLGKKRTRKDKQHEVEEMGLSSGRHGEGSDIGFARHQKKITDPRFSSLHSDPRFKLMSKCRSRVPIDSRFAALFTDEKFTSLAPVDKRGRPAKESSANHLLHHYYSLFDSEGNDDKVCEKAETQEDNREEPRKEKKKKKKKKKKQRKEAVKDTAGTGEVTTEDTALQLAHGFDGKLNEKVPVVKDGESNEDVDLPKCLGSNNSQLYSEEEILSSDNDFSETDVEDESEEEVPMVEEGTRRLAMVNMDWDHIKAVDLYVLMSSFLPEGGQVVSVAIYPSEFGLKAMEEEAIHGPCGIFASDDDEDSEENGTEIDEAKLRAYERGKLRYYYAVVECGSRATADHLYKECDGVEFERTSNILDLRFIPDNMQFNHPPRDIATEVPSNYKCKDFHTRALQQSKIHLSWDNDEPERIKTLRQKLSQKELDEIEFKDFLASDDDDDDDEEKEGDDDNGSDGDLKVQLKSDKINRKQKKRDKFFALLQSGDGSEDSKDDMDMEVTFNTDLEGISKRVLENERNKDSESVWETYLRKRREKRKARKREAKLSSEDDSSDSYEEVADQPDDDDFFVDEALNANENVDLEDKKGFLKKKNVGSKKDKRKISKIKENAASKEELELLIAEDHASGNKVKGYNLKSKKSKKDVLSDDELPEVDYNDPRLSAVFTSPLYALDPTDPRYKRSAAYLRQVSRKQKRNDDEVVEEARQLERKDPAKPDEKPARNEKLELMLLVKSVKRKVGSIHN